MINQLFLSSFKVSNNDNQPESEHVDTILTDNEDREPATEYSETESISSLVLGEDGTTLGSKAVLSLNGTISKESEMIREISIPPPGTGQKIYEIDPLLKSHKEHLDYR